MSKIGGGLKEYFTILNSNLESKLLVLSTLPLSFMLLVMPLMLAVKILTLTSSIEFQNQHSVILAVQL